MPRHVHGIAHAALVWIAVLPCAVHAAHRYTVTDLGLLPDGTFSIANCISDTGIIAGESTRDGEPVYPHSVVWMNGRILDIGGLGVSGCHAQGVNSAGIVVGISDSLQLNAFRWVDGTMLNLNTVGASFSNATGINDSGQITGFFGVSSGYRAFIWQNGKINYLPHLTQTFPFTQPTAINRAGHVTGMGSAESGFDHPFLWDGLTLHDLGTLGGNFALAKDINDLDQVVGWGDTPANSSRPWLWSNGTMNDLGTLGGLYAYANAINNAGQIVGSSSVSGNTVHAFIYEHGTMKDLNAMLPSSAASEWVLAEANDINNQGQIVGSGRRLTAPANTQRHAFLLTPVHVPGDVTDNGTVDIDDLLGVIERWGACPVLPGLCAADLDHNGTVNLDDLLAVITNWTTP
jgi:probable HAF family extracellular repeat protein